MASPCWYWFPIPIAPSWLGRAAQTEADQGSRMTQPKPQAILVVDDDDALRKLLIDYLAGHGLSATGVGTATEAVKAVASNAYSLVLLDLSLPDGDGIDLARRWRAEANISIICLTGRLEEADRVMRDP